MILNREHEVRTARGGQEALEMIRDDPPDLVFLDIRMPEMEGTEVLRRIKDISPACEVAMITAYAAVQSAQRAIRLGALDYITKPFGVAEVEDVVERALARRREEREERLLLEQLSETITQLSEQISADSRHQTPSEETLARGLASAHSSVEDQLHELLHLSSVGEVAAEVAHDMNNFLSTILFRIEIMLLDLDQVNGVDPQTLADGLQQIALAARDGGEALDRISALSEYNPYDPADQVDLNAILRDAVELSKGRIEQHQEYELSFDLADLPPVEASASGLRTVFTNLIINAYHALADAPQPGGITIRTRAADEHVTIEITDDGEGMPEEVLERLPEPFFTTKGEKGTGLGLTVVHKVIAQHHGSINFDSSPGAGTTVMVSLPVTQDEQEPVENTFGRGGVMIVDDQEGMVRVTREILQSEGCDVISASSAEDAIRTFEQTMADPHAETPRVLITDLKMPGMHGIELARRIKQLLPQTRVIILSAFLDEADPENLEIADITMQKPCNLRELRRTVSNMLHEDPAD